MSALPWSRSVPFVPQMELAECGAACLTMILRYHGCHVSLAEMRAACGVSRDGASVAAIGRAAKGYGLEVQAARLPAEALDQVSLPAMLHWQGDHFVVLEKIDRRGGRLLDPGRGRRTVSWQELAQSFSGVILSFAAGPKLVRRRRQRPSLRRYAKVLGSSTGALVLTLGASLMLELLGLLVPAGTQVLIDHVIRPAQSDWLVVVGLVLLVAALARICLTYLRDRTIIMVHLALDLGLMGGFVSHLLHLPAEFFSQRTPGDLMQRVQANAQLRDILTRAVIALLDSLVVVALAGLMLIYDPTLGSLVLALTVLRFMMLLLPWREERRRLAASELALRGEEMGATVDAFSAPELVKALGIEERLAMRYWDKLAPRLNMSLLRGALTQRVATLTRLTDALSRAAIVGLGGQAVIDDHMTLGVLAGFLTIQGLLNRPIGSLIGLAGQLNTVQGTLARMDDVLDTPAAPAGQADPGLISGEIVLEGVSFGYGHSAKPICRDISLRIAPGEKLALVGRSGAGKSTLGRLMAGLLTPSAGVVLLDGRPLHSLDPAKLRRQVGVVLQEPFLFDDTIRHNLCLLADSCSERDLHEACRIACLDDLIASLPLGYDTPVGENGCLLSGGQRQRLTIARAILMRPKVLVLDEATSALDADTEQRLHAHLAALDCTRIVIAHRLATVRDADRILVVEAGQIADQGSFDDLAAIPGPFRSLLEAAHD
jgi:ABC-type bacteriocin/lantibiotic exporter with double-glycine peptidase domain